mmetsp:Transcript_38017/g.88888  ORF Transcript_38017/g.88888 Transcript_38017/m.88888 type:complete len:572 (+) Transcript_38017:128-1843(+)|eukprot:CAMPEP_0178415314 /NCGR_PEP_ID=MMETSP0689_2-20121128/23488_1 /TAXON_ID=160604 /ORGANISM="Amphidinium massartii, Strain CS-259" /LENGTH=571 /DNA_ID=CAMNT_0020036631 /DNA_START=123 /DNA_END=1838 /DNA_ORIENTATION=+
MGGPKKKHVDHRTLEAVNATFREFDIDGDGSITREELTLVFKMLDSSYWSDRRIDKLLDIIDTNHDGRILFEEFMAWLHRGQDHDDWEEARQAMSIQGIQEFRTADLIISSQKAKIHEVWDVNDWAIDDGRYSEVYTAVNKETQAERAVKTVHKKGIDRSWWEAEIRAMKMLDHPNIVRLFEAYEDPQEVHMVMQMCAGGELFDRLISEENFTEMQSIGIMKQVFMATSYMHRMGVCHRDIRPENIMFLSPGRVETGVVKIIDFGSARPFEAGTEFEKGRLFDELTFYCAPERLRGSYTYTCDLWSLGATMYHVICGYPPFVGETDAETMSLIVRGQLAFPYENWDYVSPGAKLLVTGLLTKEPDRRYSAEEAVNNVWSQGGIPSENVGRQLTAAQANMKAYRGQNRLKKAALASIAGRLAPEDVASLRACFKALDTNNDGSISFHELKAQVYDLGKHDIGDDMARLLEEVDVDGSKRIDYTEFLASCMEKKRYKDEKVCWNAFRVFDADNNGTINKQELKAVLSTRSVEDQLGGDAIQKILQDCDRNLDGKISFEEFMSMMQYDGSGCPG